MFFIIGTIPALVYGISSSLYDPSGHSISDVDEEDMSFAESYMSTGNPNNNDFGGDMHSVAASRSVHSHHSIGALSVKSDRNNDKSNRNNSNNNGGFSFDKQQHQGAMTAPAELMRSPSSQLLSPGGGRFRSSPEKISITETLRF